MNNALYTGFSLSQLALPVLLVSILVGILILPSSRERLGELSGRFKDYFYGPDTAVISDTSAETGMALDPVTGQTQQVAEMLGFDLGEFSKRFPKPPPPPDEQP